MLGFKIIFRPGCHLADIVLQMYVGGGGEMCGQRQEHLGECVKDDMKFLGLQPEWAMFRDMWRDLVWGKHLTLGP